MNDPKIVYPQNPMTSISLLVNIVGGAITYLTVKYGLGAILTPDLQQQLSLAVAMAIMAAANVVVRKYFTGGDLSFSAPLTSTPAQTITPGTAAVVSASPSESAAPAVITPIPTGTHTVIVPPIPAPVPPPAVVTITPAA